MSLFARRALGVLDVQRSIWGGRHLWGRVEMVPATRAVWCHHLLTVYPPGTNGFERGLLVLHRNFPAFAAAVALFTGVALAFIVAPWAAFGATITLYGAGIAITSNLTRDLRSRCASIGWSGTVTGDGYRIHGDRALFDAVRAELLDIEDALRRGMITPVQFEARWGDAYRRVAGI